MPPKLDHNNTKHASCPSRAARALAFACVMSMAAVAAGQQPPMHYRHDGLAPPGVVGLTRLQRGGPVPGYFQPVEIRAPEGVKVSIASQGRFGPAQLTPLRFGLLIAPVYRFKVSNIAGYEGMEVFPTVELIDRVYPPRGQERQFPIPIELNADDIELALDGKFVTRVVYLEDPDNALPVAEGRTDQHWYDAGPGVNPLLEADRWGRPLAIVRMGGRLPDEQNGPDLQFMGGCAPFTIFRPVVERLPEGPLAEAAASPSERALRPTPPGRWARK